MYDWLNTASATFAGGAVAIALVAIPTYVWLPREFDAISDEITQNHDLLERMEPRLAGLDAKMDAYLADSASQRRDVDHSFEMLGYMAASWDRGGAVRDHILATHMSSAQLAEWRVKGSLGLFKGAIVNGQEFIFIDVFDLPKIPSQEIDALRAVATQDGYSFKVWDVGRFPGQNFYWE